MVPHAMIVCGQVLLSPIVIFLFMIPEEYIQARIFKAITKFNFYLQVCDSNSFNCAKAS